MWGSVTSLVDEHAYFSTIYVEFEEHYCTETYTKRNKGFLWKKLSKNFNFQMAGVPL